jgi:hypothetical protein
VRRANQRRNVRRLRRRLGGGTSTERRPDDLAVMVDIRTVVLQIQVTTTLPAVPNEPSLTRAEPGLYRCEMSGLRALPRQPLTEMPLTKLGSPYRPIGPQDRRQEPPDLAP